MKATWDKNSAIANGTDSISITTYAYADNEPVQDLSGKQLGLNIWVDSTLESSNSSLQPYTACANWFVIKDTTAGAPIKLTSKTVGTKIIYLEHPISHKNSSDCPLAGWNQAGQFITVNFTKPISSLTPTPTLVPIPTPTLQPTLKPSPTLRPTSTKVVDTNYTDTPDYFTTFNIVLFSTAVILLIGLITLLILRHRKSNSR